MEFNSNAPSCTVKASMYDFIGTYIDKKDGNKVKVLNPRNYSKLKVKSLKEIIYSQLNIPEGTEKNHSGAVYAFAYDIMYAIDDPDIDFHSSGVVFQDLDHVPAEELQILCDNFDLLCQKLPDLLCMHYSSSGKGLHLYYLSPKFTPREYTKRVILNYIRLGVVCSKFLNIELPEDVCDPAQVGLKQRFFLNRPLDSKIHWNDNAFGTIFNQEQEDELINKEIYKFGPLTKKWESLNYKPTENVSSITDKFDSNLYNIERKNKIVQHLDHQSRMRLYSSLRVVFNDKPDIVEREWDYCIHHMEFNRDHKTQLGVALREPDRNRSWKTYKTPHLSREFFLFYYMTPLVETKCEEKERKTIRNKEPKPTDEERELLEKYF